MKFTLANSDGEIASEHIDSDDEQDEQYPGQETNRNKPDDIIDSNEASYRRKIPLLKLVGNGVCSVCGGRGHKAGFVGARYVDCINKPW